MGTSLSTSMQPQTSVDGSDGEGAGDHFFDAIESESRQSSHHDPLREVALILRDYFNEWKLLSDVDYDDFVRFVIALNNGCAELIDDSNKRLVFATQKGTDEGPNWKRNVRIACMKCKAESGEIESSRVITLPQFLRLRETLLSLGVFEFAEAADQPVLLRQSSAQLRASMIFDKIDEEHAPLPTDLTVDCIICLERKPDVVLKCAHAYCLVCIERWNVMRAYCPMCRSRMRDTTDAWVVVDDRPTSSDIRRYVMGSATG